MDNELFERLGDQMAYSDLYYVDIVSQLVGTIATAIEAFKDRNNQTSTNEFILSTVAGLVKTIYNDDTDKDKDTVYKTTLAYLGVLNGQSPEEFLGIDNQEN